MVMLIVINMANIKILDFSKIDTEPEKRSTSN